MVYKCGAFTQSPSVTVFVDSDAELGLPLDEWGVTVARTPAEYWRRRNDLYETARFDVLTASAVLEIPAGKAAPSIAEVLEVFPARQEHLLVQINKGTVVAKFDARHPPDVDEATRKLFTEQKTGPKKVALAGRPKARKSGWTSPITATPILSEVVIDGFSGEIYDGSRGKLGEKRQQYATSSYDAQSEELPFEPVGPTGSAYRSADPMFASACSVSEPFDHRLPEERGRCRPGNQVRHER